MVYKIANLGLQFVQTDSRGDTDYVDGCNAVSRHWPLLLELPEAAKSMYSQ